MAMALERRIAFVVFAIGVLIVVVALVGCGDDDKRPQKPSETGLDTQADLPPQPESPRGCSSAPLGEEPILESRLDRGAGVVELVYIGSGSAAPCEATMAINGVTVEISLLSLDPRVASLDMVTHCAIIRVGRLPSEGRVRDANGGAEYPKGASGSRREKRYLFGRGTDCKPVPVAFVE